MFQPLITAVVTYQQFQQWLEIARAAESVRDSLQLFAPEEEIQS